jgi:methyltransferase family protein
LNADAGLSELLPPEGRVLAVGAESEPLLDKRDDSSITRVEADQLETLAEQRFDVVLLAGVLEQIEDPVGLLRQVQPLLADDGAVVASIPNAAHGSVRLAVLAGRLGRLLNGNRFYSRESIEDLFEETGYVITHWKRERTEIEGSLLFGRDSIRELLASDPESTTSRFAVRAVPSDGAAQLAAAHAELRAARSELDSLRHSLEETEALREELATLRRAHEEQGRRLVAERLEFANELAELQRQIHLIHQSRSFRYTAPLRRFFGGLRGRG